MLNLTLCVLLALSLISCGSDTKTGTGANNRRTFDNEEDFRLAFNSSTVYCGESQNDCPNNVAKLTFGSRQGNKYVFGVCSGTLVDDQYIITNRHCIPKNLQVNGISCRNRIVAHFPSTRTSIQEKVDCIKVVQVFAKRDDQPDLAVIKVERTRRSRDAVVINKNSLVHNQEIHAYTMNPSSIGSSGTIRKKTCNVSLDNLFYLKQNKAAGNMLITGSRCNVIGGNSGSGFFNSKGEMVGVVHSRLDQSDINKLFRDAGVPHDIFKKSGIIANIGCIGNINSASRSRCKMNVTGTVKKYIDEKVTEAGLDGVDEQRIEAKVTSHFGIRLKESDSNFNLYSLSSIRRKLEKFYKASNFSIWKEVADRKATSF